MKILLLALLLLSTQLLANVGIITALKGKASIDRAGNDIPASLGSSLEKKDHVLTQDNTKLQIIFNDDTIVSLGKNSNFSVSEYLFEDGQEPIAKFGILKGAMRTITGKIGKIAPKKFSVETKTATIGIRGTNFTIVVAEDSSFTAYCTYGAISVTIDEKEYVVRQGYFITISATGKVLISAFTPKSLKEMRKIYFGISAEKDTSITKSAQLKKDPGQLDVTIDDDTEVIISEIDSNTQDIIQNETTDIKADVTTYVMNNAHYTGDYEVTSESGGGTSLGIAGSGPVSGGAILDIDFGADTASLKLYDDPSGGAPAAVTYSSNPSFTSTGFTVEHINGAIVNNVTGTFSDSIGNTVNGTFSHNDGTGSATPVVSSGTYNVTSSQVLH